MNDYYNSIDYKYTEILITDEDFIYDSYVKCILPSMLPLTDLNSPTTGKINTSNIMNVNINSLGIDKYIPRNYINIYVPKELADIDTLTDYVYNQTKTNNRLSYIPTGKKGEKFVASFIGGNINNCKIIGRYYE